MNLFIYSSISTRLIQFLSSFRLIYSIFLEFQIEQIKNKLNQTNFQIRPVYKRQQDSYDRILKCVTHLIYLLVKTAKSDDERAEAQRLVYNLVRQSPRSASTGDSLLHLCVSRLNTIKSSYFPADDVQVSKFIVSCFIYNFFLFTSRYVIYDLSANYYVILSPLFKTDSATLLCDYRNEFRDLYFRYKSKRRGSSAFILPSEDPG